MGFRIREANVTDLDAAARVRAQAWRESFAELVPPEVLDNAEAWAPQVAQAWADEMVGRGAHVWVGVDEAGQLVAVARADAAFEVDAPASLELKTLYVLDRAKGSGLASALLHRAIGDEAPAYLWVIEGNETAIGFYRRHGFELDGAGRDIEPGWPGARQVRMLRSAPLDADEPDPA